ESAHFNSGLREAFRLGLPLLYFRGVRRGLYIGLGPVVIVGDDPTARTVTVACNDIDLVRPDLPTDVAEDVRRSYTTALTMQRGQPLRVRGSVVRAAPANRP